VTPNLRHTNEHGQTMAEYALVLGVISIGVIVALGLFTGAISTAITAVSNAIP
jgi:Flp pilus assembly pilin Flp